MSIKMNFLFFVGLILCINENEILGEAAPREPSIQAYGLPKRFPTGSNGFIERVRLTEKNESEKSKHTTSAPSATTRTKFEPTISARSYDDAGVIEIFHLEPSSTSGSRSVRSIEPEDQAPSENDLEAQESKVFRPLFVYRRQLEAKQRNARSERARRNNLLPSYSNNKKASQFSHNCLRSK